MFEKFTERNWRILTAVTDVARHLGKSPAQVALNWAATQPGITSTIIGATKVAQFEDNLAALEFSIPAELRARLDEVSALPPAHPYMFFGAFIQSRVNGDTPVRRWEPARVGYETSPAERASEKAKATAAEQ